jgi:hypothetical protein
MKVVITLALLLTLWLSHEPTLARHDLRQVCPTGAGAALMDAPMPCQMEALRRATDATQRALTKALVGLSDALYRWHQEKRS